MKTMMRFQLIQNRYQLPALETGLGFARPAFYEGWNLCADLTNRKVDRFNAIITVLKKSDKGSSGSFHSRFKRSSLRNRHPVRG